MTCACALQLRAVTTLRQRTHSPSSCLRSHLDGLTLATCEWLLSPCSRSWSKCALPSAYSLHYRTHDLSLPDHARRSSRCPLMGRSRGRRACEFATQYASTVKTVPVPVYSKATAATAAGKYQKQRLVFDGRNKTVGTVISSAAHLSPAWPSSGRSSGPTTSIAVWKRDQPVAMARQGSCPKHHSG
jgi:hypothetical protein